MADDFWIIVLSSGITAALVSSLFSILGNYLYFRWKFKKETTASYIQARIECYSRIWFFLRLWLLEPIDPPPTTSKLDEIDPLISSRLDLISEEIQNDWLKIRELIVEEEHEEAVLMAQSLVDRVRAEFNEKLVPEFEKYVGSDIQKLSEYVRAH